MRPLFLLLVLCLLLTACTVGIVKQEMLTPGASTLPTPTFMPSPADTTPSPVPATPINHWETEPTPTSFAPLITANVDSRAITADARNLELLSLVRTSAVDVAVQRDFAYVADTYVGLQIVDVSAIHMLGKGPGLSRSLFGRGDAASCVVVQGERAYVSSGGLRMIDISTPTTPKEIGSYPVDTRDIAMLGNYAYVAAGLEGLRVIDVSDPTSPIEVGFYDTPDHYVQGVAVSNQHAYVAGSDGVRILNITDPTNLVEVGLYDVPAAAWDVTVAGDYAYVSWNWRMTQRAGCSNCLRGMSILDISDNHRVTEVGTYNIMGEVSDVVVLGNYAYVAAGEAGLRVVDVSNPTSPREIGFYDTPGDAFAVAATDDHVYVADLHAGLLVLRFVPPDGISRFPTPSSPSLSGVWRKFTVTDGLCTNWPLFIGSWYIGTGNTTVCYAWSPFDVMLDEIDWLTRTVPLGTQVTAVDKLPPGGGEIYATDAGVCWYVGYDWECQLVEEGYPYEDIRRIAHVKVDPVFMLGKSVVYQEQIYSIPEILGVEDSYPTWLAVSGEHSAHPEIWVGTRAHGIVVIRPSRGNSTLYTTADGLPGNTIRDINTGAENYHLPDLHDVWVATDNGVAHWDGIQWIAYTVADGLPSNDVRGVASRLPNTVWAATAGGAAYFDRYSWQAVTHEDGLPPGDLNGVITRLNQVWFSTRGDGLLVFEPE